MNISNDNLEETVETDSDLKGVIVDYIGNKLNPETGEVYWEEPSDEEWTDEDDELTSSLLMYGGLQNTIGEYYV